MKRYLIPVLALTLLLGFAGCRRQEIPAEPQILTEAPAAAQPAPVVPEAPPPEEEKPPEELLTVYACGGLEFPVPRDYDALLAVETEPERWSDHWEPLISFSERASVEAGKQDHPDEDWGDGWLCTIMRLDQIGFEDWASGDEQPGTSLFARDGNGYYYLIACPTDVRFYRSGDRYEDGAMEAWQKLNAWAETLPDEVIRRNGLTPYRMEDVLGGDYTYPGAHVELGYSFPGEPMDQVILVLSQPVRQGEGGVWCVERVRFVYSDYDWTDTHLAYPAALGVNMTAADYYAQLQAECDAGEHPDLLTAEGAALSYARQSAWIFGDDVSATDFEYIETLG